MPGDLIPARIVSVRGPILSAKNRSINNEHNLDVLLSTTGGASMGAFLPSQ